MSHPHLVEGFGEWLDGNGELLQGPEWIERAAWRRYFRQAWMIPMRAGRAMTWRASVLPKGVAPQDQVVLVWDMGMGSYSAFPQPTGQFNIAVNGQSAIAICDQVGNRDWRKGDWRFHYEIKRREGNASYGLGYLMGPARAFAGTESPTITITASDSDSDAWFMLCAYGEGCLATGISFNEPNAAAAFVDDGVRRVGEGRERAKEGEYQLYWGDLHVHSNMANYIAASGPEDYAYGRHVANLDFMAITDQEHFLTDRMFAAAAELANRHNLPGEFAAFIAFEWSSRRYGHRNVLFRGDKGVCIRRHDVEKPYEPPFPREMEDSYSRLRAGLKQFGEPCLLLPHHPAMTSMGSFDWSHFDPELEPAVEIYSLWGSSEHRNAPGRSMRNDERSGSFVQDALARGYRLGIIGSGETGDGHPGNTQWRGEYARKAGMPLSRLGGGLAGVWATELTRAGIFDAIKARRCYGTTSARTTLRFKANGHWMGSDIHVSAAELKAGVPVAFDLAVDSETDIDAVHLFRNGRIVRCLPGYGPRLAERFNDSARLEDCITTASEHLTYYYVRVVMQNGHLAWSSPVWFTAPIVGGK